MQKANKHTVLFDTSFGTNEQLPRKFTISFNEIVSNGQNQVKVLMDGCQVGDVIDDNSYEDDFYRYHDIFHFTFAAMLGWSPCARSMVRRKRKSDPVIDKIEDGARAAITEEAISLIIFNEARRKNFFEDQNRVSRTTLRIIKEMTEPFEVKVRTKKDWESAILKSYELFRQLKNNKGGHVIFDMSERKVEFAALDNN